MQEIVLDETLHNMDKNNDGYVTEQEYVGKALAPLVAVMWFSVFAEDIWLQYERDSGEEPEWLKSEREHFTTHRSSSLPPRYDVVT